MMCEVKGRNGNVGGEEENNKGKSGAKLEDFAVGEQPVARRKTAARRKAIRRKKSGRSRRAKK